MKRWRRFLSGCLALSLCAGLSIPAAYAGFTEPNKSDNVGAQDYWKHSERMYSYLFENDTGGLTRVELVRRGIIVENYDDQFRFLDGLEIPSELDIWGGFFAGEEYNFFIFGGFNYDEDDDVEVIRVVKYSKDWKRLGHASLFGANTTIPFDGGNVRCDEYGGYLYVRTCHEMYETSDGIHHQANLTFAVNQDDMTISDSYYGIMNRTYGYVSHSFNQFILVDEEGRIVAVDHGDAGSTRGVVFTRYYSNASTGKFSGARYSSWCDSMNLCDFPGESGDNTTGASVGGLAETNKGYVVAYNFDGEASFTDRYIHLSFVNKDGKTRHDFKVTDMIRDKGSLTPMLAPTGLDGGYLIWNEKPAPERQWESPDILHYVSYDEDGMHGDIQTATGSLSDCQPIPYQGGAVWYVTEDYKTTPVFYFLKDGELTLFDTAQPEETLPAEESPAPTETPSTETVSSEKKTDADVPAETTETKEEDSTRFSDVKKTDWYYDTVMDLVEKGAVDGFPDGTFGPEKPITMIELCKIAEELFPPLYTSEEQYGAEVVEQIKRTVEAYHPNFWGNSIIADSNMAYLFIEAGIEQDEHPERWTEPITRAFMTRLLYQIYSLCAENNGQQLRIDSEIYAAIGDYVTGGIAGREELPHILWAYSSGLVGGVNGNGDFSPDSQVTRAEACTILSRLLNKEKRLTVDWTTIEAKVNAPLSAPGMGTDTFGNARLKYAEDVAYDYARQLEVETGMKISYLPEYTEKSSSLFQHSDMSPFITSPMYFQRVLLELHTLKESLDQYSEGFIREVVLGKGSHSTEIVLCPVSINGLTRYGCYIYDDSNDVQKVDQIFYTGTGSVYFYTHEMGHMVMSAAAIKRGYSATKGKWQELFEKSYQDDGCVSTYAMTSAVEDWAETWAYLWIDPYTVRNRIENGASSLDEKVTLLTEMLLQYQNISADALPWYSLVEE